MAEQEKRQARPESYDAYDIRPGEPTYPDADFQKILPEHLKARREARQSGGGE